MGQARHDNFLDASDCISPRRRREREREREREEREIILPEAT
jgi:hypothetical protein